MIARSLITVFIATLFAGCTATPANKVEVETMSMDEALTLSRKSQAALRPAADSKVVRSVITPGRPSPIVTAPDIRMGYVYEWTDSEGNMHYPGWVAIQVEASKWIMPELGPIPMDGSVSTQPVAVPEGKRGLR